MQPVTKIYLTCRDVPDNTIVKIAPFNEERVLENAAGRKSHL